MVISHLEEKAMSLLSSLKSLSLYVIMQYGISALVPRMPFCSKTSGGIENSLQASSLGCFSGGVGKGRRACNYVSGI